METIIILAIVGVGAFFLLSGKASASTIDVPPPTGGGGIPVNPVGGIPTSVSTGAGTQGDLVSSIVQTGASTATKVVGTAGTAAGTAAGAGIGLAAGVATAGVAAVATIFAVLWSAHKKREAQAKDENSAMNTGVAGFDQDIRAINAAYNSHQIDTNTAIQALKQILQQYWMLVFPHLQPGRNGCGVTAQGSANCPNPSGNMDNYCQGSIGAACCVGCVSLNRSLYYDGSLVPPSNISATDAAKYKIPGAIVVLQRGTGGQSRVFKVFPSKYGGNTREEYYLTWAKPV